MYEAIGQDCETFALLQLATAKLKNNEYGAKNKY